MHAEYDGSRGGESSPCQTFVVEVKGSEAAPVHVPGCARQCVLLVSFFNSVTLTPGLCWLAWYCRSPSYRTPVCGDGLPDYRDEEAFRRRVSDPDGFFYKEPINANGQVRRAEWWWWWW